MLIGTYASASLLSYAAPAYAQSMSEAIKQYDQPARIQHMTIESQAESAAPNAASTAPASAPKPNMHSYQVEDVSNAAAAAVAVEAAPEGETGSPYIRNPQSAIEAVKSATDQEPQDEMASPLTAYKSSGVTLTDIERFPDLGELTQWPWLRELTYGPENPATQNAMVILDRDLAKASPLAMIWAAQHYYDSDMPDKALFLYLVSRLRSAVDQARFEQITASDLSASEENMDVERSAGLESAGSGIKSLSSYKTIAGSIGRPIIKFGLKHPQRYETQLNAAMLWDRETPYEYLPSVNDLLINESKREQWGRDYQKIAESYQQQMSKLITLTTQ
tara:strand:+ start:51125 stop:52123 length:999 start_codon:yes stop_codon:yes gene_type:complete